MNVKTFKWTYYNLYLCRLLTIWQDRNIFEPKVQSEMAKIWTAKSLEASNKEGNDNGTSTPPPAKKQKLDSKYYAYTYQSIPIILFVCLVIVLKKIHRKSCKSFNSHWIVWISQIPKRLCCYHLDQHDSQKPHTW